MKKLIIAMGLAVLTAVSATANTAYLEIHDNNGNSTGVISSGTGVVTFNGTIGNWTINVTTGIADPPSGIRPATAPEIDLNSVNKFGGGTGGTLTITFYADGLGPVSSIMTHQTGGTQATGTTSKFEAQVNGSTVNTQNATTSPFALSDNIAVSAGANSTFGIVATLTATVAGLTSFDSNFAPVPDAGMTLALLGSALTGLALFARNRKTA